MKNLLYTTSYLTGTGKYHILLCLCAPSMCHEKKSTPWDQMGIQQGFKRQFKFELPIFLLVHQWLLDYWKRKLTILHLFLCTCRN